MSVAVGNQAVHLPSVAAPVAAMPTGIFKEWLEIRGFGVITPDDGSDDVLMHREVATPGHGVLSSGDKVEYEIPPDDGQERRHRLLILCLKVTRTQCARLHEAADEQLARISKLQF